MVSDRVLGLSGDAVRSAKNTWGVFRRYRQSRAGQCGLSFVIIPDSAQLRYRCDGPIAPLEIRGIRMGPPIMVIHSSKDEALQVSKLRPWNRRTERPTYQSRCHRIKNIASMAKNSM